MKTKLKRGVSQFVKFNINYFLAIGLVLAAQVAWAQDKVGGGGDASEIRVNEIRSDILNWIANGGSKGLKLPVGMDVTEYNKKMNDVLGPKRIVVGFVTSDDSVDEELRVEVDGNSKTCRGFISKKDQRPHILCNISRFENTKEARQYRLIHHEYAGLAGLEKNDGGASDYEISDQITDYLVTSTVLRLAVKPRTGLNVTLDLNHKCKASLEKAINERQLRLDRIEKTLIVMNATVVGMPVGLPLIGVMARQENLNSNMTILENALAFSKYSRKQILEVLNVRSMPSIQWRRDWQFKKLNAEREAIGIRKMTVEEFDVLFPISEEFSTISSKNDIDLLLDLLNETSDKKLTYEELRSFLYSKRETDYFCNGPELPRVGRRYLKKLANEIP